MKLSLKLAGLITIFALSSAAMFALLSYIENKERVEQRTARSISSLVATVSSMASTSAYVNDMALAQEVVSGLQLNNEIRCAEIHTANLHAFSSAGCVGQALVEQALLSPWDDSEPVGTIRVFQSDQHIDMLVKEQFYHELSLLINVIFIVSVTIFVITHFLIAKPISGVSTKLGLIDFQRDINLLTEAGRSDELGRISRVINRMIVHAEKQIITQKILARKTEELSTHFRLIFQLSKNSLAVTDEHLKVKSFNPTFEKMVRRVQPNADMLNSDSWIYSVTSEVCELKSVVKDVADNGLPITTDVRMHFKHEQQLVEHFYSITFVKSLSEDMNVSILFFIYDQTEQRKKLEKTEYEASHDNLTSLYNRRAASKKIRHLLSARQAAEQTAILFLDLDGFKQVNDEFGHEAGDIVLKEVGLRLKGMTRKSDVACRWGGDEFLVALNNVNLSEATKSANKILKTVIEPIELNDGVTCEIGCSIGVTLSTEKISDFQTLYDHADKAMYRVKKGSKNAVLVLSI